MRKRQKWVVKNAVATLGAGSSVQTENGGNNAKHVLMSVE